MKSEKSNKTLLLIVIIIVIAIWLISWLLTDFYFFPIKEGINKNEIISNRGAFGDKFGFINSLFSGLALAGIVISIYFQQKELTLQRKELIETREEFEDQNFQTTFFNLLKTQRQLGNEILTEVRCLIELNEYINKELKGRIFFIQSKFELIKIQKALKFERYLPLSEWENEFDEPPYTREELNYYLKTKKIAFTIKYYRISEEMWKNAQEKTSLELGQISYNIFFNRFHFVIGHYFRHIYHIFNFLENKENEKKQLASEENEIDKIKKEFNSYANFVQAQMTTPELFLLFYNSLSFPKLLKLLKKYNILENLTVEDLISEEDNAIEGINLKSRKKLL